MGSENDRKTVQLSREPRALEASELFDGGKEIAIRFGRDVYRLRITRNNKLILTK